MANPREPSHLRLAVLILEGYVYLLLIVGTFVGAIALLAWGLLARRPLVGLVALFIGVPLVITTANAIRALFFRLPEPQGLALTSAQAPALHEMIEHLRRQVQAPPVHRLMIGYGFNASASQLPRAVVFGTRNTLSIGYPLLATLPPEHVRAVVAHELGHLSRAHGRFTVRVYRTRQSWSRLMASLDARGATPTYAHFLFAWYGRRLHKYSALVARQQELLADRCAATAAGRAFSAETLVAIEAAASEIERTYWREVYSRVEHDREPPRPFADMGPELWNTIPDDSDRLMEHLLADRTVTDTHPSLRDRLGALGEEARLPTRVERTAGDVYLGPQMAIVAAALDAEWKAAHEEDWRKQHEAFNQRRGRLRELAALPQPTHEEVFERAQLVEGFEGPDDALPHYRDASERGHQAATLAVGRILLDRDDDSGVPLIEQAMAADPRLIREGCARVIAYLETRNRMTEAHRFTILATRHATRNDMAETERTEVSPLDRFTPHTLTADELAALVGRLSGQPEVTRAFIAIRDLRYSTGRELVCAIQAIEPHTQGLVDTLRRADLLPADAKIRLLNRHDQPLRAALESVPGSLIYERHQ